MITLSPGSVSTMSEAPLAASVASATAIPISAFFKAGASFTPSPVIPTITNLGTPQQSHQPFQSIPLPGGLQWKHLCLDRVKKQTEALAAKRRTWSFSTPFANTSTKFLSTLSLLRVKVPVLSLHSTSMPAISSMAVILLVMAPCWDSLWDPIAIVTDKTVGMAIGMPPIKSTSRLSIPSLNGAYTEVPNGSEDFLEVPDLVEPEKTSSPGCLVTGRDSPVRAD
nr:hypothetical protein ZEAMMB73_Zm00001d050215 [Ipomoea batatas]